MKKVLMTLVAVALAFGVSAQKAESNNPLKKLVIGGSFNLHHDNTHADDYVTGTSTASFKLAPKIGYQMNDKMQIGLELGYTVNYERNYGTSPATLDEDNYTSTNSPAWGDQPIFTLAPYLRYNIGTLKKFTVFCEAKAAFGFHLESYNYNNVTETTVDNADNFTQIGLSIVPGLNYAVNNHLSIDLYINLIRCYATFTTADGWGGHEYGIGADLSSQTINNQLNNFSLGFNYRF